MIRIAEKITGNSIAVIKSSRRPGDPEILVADSKLIKQDLGWKPKYENLDGIIADAWNWEILDNKRCL